MEAYQTSTSTLRGILKNPLLDLEEVERTTEEMAEVVANQEEVDSALRIGGELATKAGGVVEVDEDELKRELEEMVRDERERERERERQRAEEEKEKVTEDPPAPVLERPAITQPKPVESTRSVTSVKQHGEDQDALHRERYEDAQQRQREEATRAEVERMRKAEKVAAE